MKRLSVSDNSKLLSILNKYRDCFVENLAELGHVKETEMVIHLKDDQPVTYRPYHLSFKEDKRYGKLSVVY